MMLSGVERPVVAVLGLTYKPGTDTLRRSASVELCRWMASRGISVRAYDPAVRELPADLRETIQLSSSSHDGLRGADLAVVATEWPEFRALKSEDFVTAMRHPAVIDQNWFLSAALDSDSRLRYVTTGRDSAGAR
jgi:UDPglucose 6-dehydrogenase